MDDIECDGVFVLQILPEKVVFVDGCDIGSAPC